MAAASVSEALERVATISLLFAAAVSDLSSVVEVSEKRTVAMTVVLGLRRREAVSPKPIPIGSREFMREKGVKRGKTSICSCD
jgi:hypothetical protein